MPGLDRRGPQGEGPMTGRGMGQCNSDNRGETGNEIRNAVAGLAAALVIGATKIIWNWIREKRLKKELK